MRPPEHWHLRTRPKRNPWPPVAVLVSALCVAVLATVWCRAGGAETPSDARASLAVCNDSAPCTPTPALETFGSNAPAPHVRALAATVIEASCAAPLYTKNASAQLPPASLTKMMTAIIVYQRLDFDEIVEIDVNGALLVASTGASIMGLEPGMQLSVRDLMYGMMLPSGNDAALQLARAVAGSEAAFVDLMNIEAQRIGLYDTRFSNPDGLDQAELYTTARDAALLGRAYMQVPDLAAIARTERYLPNWDRGELLNGNELIGRYRGATGVKTGYTELAGQTVVASAERSGRSLIVAVLGSYDRYADATSLFDWAFRSTRPACD